jgi:light-regulated signal transduction histidine kinase (bacteriophytochrome)
VSEDVSAFQVDLTNCDREPIHVLGNIQPFGFLLTVGADWLISRVSDNIEDYIGKTPEQLLGEPLVEIFEAQAIHNIRNRLTVMRGQDAVERLFGEALIAGAPAFDLSIHFSGDMVVIEAEPSSEDALEAAGLVRTLIARLGQTETLAAFIRESARQVRAITGFDRVMVYRFDDSGSGEVVAEALKAGTDSFLGLHYPASDIPAQARKLYERNVFRIIADVNAAPVALQPGLDPKGQPLDLSLSVLRAVSPIHIEYLRNMGVSASLSISIIVGGKLWGLFACHHYSPRLPGLSMRTAAELFGQMFSLMLESRERSEAADYETRARTVTDRMMATIAQDGDLLRNAGWLGEVIFDTIPSDGVAVYLNNAIAFSGLTPNAEQFRQIVKLLNRAASSEIFATDSIKGLIPEAEAYADVAAGFIAIPLSRSPRDYVVLFRSEQMRSVRWAGNPEKSVEFGPNGSRLTPRKSFESWSQLVKGKSLPFTNTERRVAEALRVGVLEVLVRLADVAGEERQQAHERQELLITELNHRVRNILSLIRGLISQTREGASSVDGFVGNLESRIQALARAHDQVTRDRWGPGRLMDLLEVEARAYLGAAETRVKLDGPNVLLKPAAFTTLALVFHELLTNAVKYGALSDSGSVSISWHLDEDGSLMLDWLESGGPAVTMPTRRGFGSTVIEKAIPHDLGGHAELHYRMKGLSGSFCIPSRHIAGIGTGIEHAPVAAAMASEPQPLLGKTVMLVEDSMIIALDGEDALRSLGAADVQLAASVPGAFSVLDREAIDLAILDYNLGVETSQPIADSLKERSIPFIFVTGYGEMVVDPAENVPVVAKPYGPAQLRDAVARLKAAAGAKETV